MWRVLLVSVGLGAAGFVGWAVAQSPNKPEAKKNLPTESAGPPATSDVELVERCIAARKEYENSLRALYEHYHRIADKQRSQWTEQELMGYHLIFKPSYNLDVKDVPPATLEAKVNIREANEMYRSAMDYKGRGFGSDYTLNQRRAEVLLREILEKYSNSDKISDVAYQLGDIYESKAFKQYDRAATLYDKQLNDRSKAIELYRDEIAHDTDTERIKQAEKRLSELVGQKK